MGRTAPVVLVVSTAACSGAEATPPASQPDKTAATPSALPSASGESYDALIEQGSRQVQTSELAAARKSFTRAHELAPDRIEARYGLGVVDARTCWTVGQQCGACIARMSDVLERGGYRHAQYNRGQCLLMHGRAGDALADLDAAIAASPADPDYFEARAATLLKLNREDEACRDFERAAALEGRVDGVFRDLCPKLGPARKP